MSAINEKFGMPDFIKNKRGGFPNDQKVDGHFSENDKREASKGMEALENYLSKGAVTFPKDLEALDALKAFVRNNKTPSFDQANHVYDTVADFRNRFEGKLDKSTKQSLDRILAEVNHVLLHPSKEDLKKHNFLEKKVLDSYIKMLSDKSNIAKISVDIHNQGSFKINRIEFADGSEMRLHRAVVFFEKNQIGKYLLVLSDKTFEAAEENRKDLEARVGRANVKYDNDKTVEKYMDRNDPTLIKIMNLIDKIEKKAK